MKRYLFLLWLVLGAQHQIAQAQDRVIDSLRRLVPQAKNDFIKVQLLLNIGLEFNNRIRKLDSALSYYQKALDLARQRNIIQLQLLASNNVANVYNHSTGNYSEALRILLQNLE